MSSADEGNQTDFIREIIADANQARCPGFCVGRARSETEENEHERKPSMYQSTLFPGDHPPPPLSKNGSI